MDNTGHHFLIRSTKNEQGLTVTINEPRRKYEQYAHRVLGWRNATQSYDSILQRLDRTHGENMHKVIMAMHEDGYGYIEYEVGNEVETEHGKGVIVYVDEGLRPQYLVKVPNTAGVKGFIKKPLDYNCDGVADKWWLNKSQLDRYNCK